MRSLALALILATPAAAETLSEEIGRTGLAPTEARLAALPSPSNEDLFALAGLRFLGGIEQALQLRWKTGVQADWSELPILRLPIPENPDAIPFQAADFTALIKNLDADMDASREALAQLGDKPFALPIRMADLWFDINANGTREAGEGIAEVTGMALGGGRMFGVQVQDPVLTFDTADAAWLSAYTHFLSGFASTALAYDPEPAIQRVIDSSKAIYALWGTTPPNNAMDMMFGRSLSRTLHDIRVTEDRRFLPFRFVVAPHGRSAFVRPSFSPCSGEFRDHSSHRAMDGESCPLEEFQSHP